MTPTGTIPEGFEVRPVRSDAEAEGYAALNEAVGGEGDIARRLLGARPATGRQDFIVAVEKASGRIVSTTCLLPWELSFLGITLKVAMLEMVVTDPAFRRHGLVRAQVDVFHERARAAGSDLCIIQGIPYYYRQFGYSYALDHTPSVRLTAAQAVNAGPAGRPASSVSLRPAAAADFPAAARAYDAEMSRQALFVRRSLADWAYLAGPAGRKVEMVVKGDGTLAGYAITSAGSDMVTVSESGLLDPADAPGTLRALAARASGSLVVVGNAAHVLARAAVEAGGDSFLPGQWLVRIENPSALLRLLGPVLEGRLEHAGHRGYEGDLVLNFFRNALLLRFRSGKLSAVEDAGFVDATMGHEGGDLNIPPDAFPRLLFGYRDIETLRDAWPDIHVRESSREILQALFPCVDSLVLMPY